MRTLLLTLIFIVAGVSANAAQPQFSDRHAALKMAFAAAESGKLDFAQASRYADDPLFPWLQATLLRKQISSAKPEQIQSVLQHWGDQPAARWLRKAWLNALAQQQDWSNFRLAYQGSDDLELRCADLAARLDAGATDAVWVADVQAIWLTATTLPERCDVSFAELARLGKLGNDLRWQRIDLAAQSGQTALMRHLAKNLSASDAALVFSYAAFIDAPTAAPTHWPTTARSRNIATIGLMRLAKRDPDRANHLLRSAAHVFALDETQRGRVRYEIALWTVASYLPNAVERLNTVPESIYDEKLHEWRVREAISRGDDVAALAGIEKMGAAQRNDSRWQYFEARLRERLNQTEAAQSLYKKAATTASFYGWLAADRLKQPYCLCALEPAADIALRNRVNTHAGFLRALDLFAINRPGLAALEWSDAIKTMSDDERRVAVQRAIDAGWYDRAVFAMNISADDTRYYSLRFPLHHESDIRAQAKINGLDPAWVAAQTRAESAFMPNARSAADARGLMQLLPGTGELTAQRLGLAWQGGDSLYQPITNLTLGTAYLRQMLDRFKDLPYLAIAAYNAGPAPVQRWLQARSQLDPDFFIESIPYKETREYVARVFAFSVVYDWRLNKNAAPLSQRLVGHLVDNASQRHAFLCPQPIATSP